MRIKLLGRVVLATACLALAVNCRGKAGKEEAEGGEATAPRAVGVAEVPGSRYRFKCAPDDATLEIFARVPTEKGQEIYVRYRAPYWEEMDPTEAVSRGGFELAADGGNNVRTTVVTEAADQDFHETRGKLLKLECAGEFAGDVTAVVYLAEGGTKAVPLGPAERPYYRTGVVDVASGIQLRARPDTAADSLGVLAKGTKVGLTGGEVYFLPPSSAGIADTIEFVEVVKAGRRGWAAAGNFGGEVYISIGDFAVY